MICKHLNQLLDHELSNGNSIVNTETGWSAVSLAVNLKEPLNPSFCEEYLDGKSNLETWENKDRHYRTQKGIICKTCRHSIAGPLP